MSNDKPTHFAFPLVVDGIDCTVTVRPDRGQWVYPKHGRSYFVGARPTGVYVWEAGESILENFALRSSRPVDVYRRFAAAAVARLDPTVKLRWDVKTGCSMCPCSPGFKVFNADGQRLNLVADGFVRSAGFGNRAERFDISITVGAKLTEPTAEAEWRIAQLLANPGIKETLKV